MKLKSAQKTYLEIQYVIVSSEILLYMNPNSPSRHSSQQFQVLPCLNQTEFFPTFSQDEQRRVNTSVAGCLRIQPPSEVQVQSHPKLLIFQSHSHWVNCSQKTSSQKLRQNKQRYSREIIKKYKSFPENLPLLRVTPKILRIVQ